MEIKKGHSLEFHSIAFHEIPFNGNFRLLKIYNSIVILSIFNTEKDTPKGILCQSGTNKSLFQLDSIDRLTLFGGDEIGINLGCRYRFVGQHLRDSINVCACSDLKRGVCVTETVEGDMLLDA